MLKDAYPYFLANEAVYANQDLDVVDKYSGEVATRVALADAAAIEQAIAAADDSFEAMRNMPAYQRQDLAGQWIEQRYARAVETWGDRQVPVAEALDPATRRTKRWEVPPGHLVLLGDNRIHSVDSTAFGPVPEQNVRGIVFQIWALATPGVHHAPGETAPSDGNLAAGLVSLALLWIVIGFLVFYLRQLLKENTRIRQLYHTSNDER